MMTLATLAGLIANSSPSAKPHRSLLGHLTPSQSPPTAPALAPLPLSPLPPAGSGDAQESLLLCSMPRLHGEAGVLHPSIPSLCSPGSLYPSGWAGGLQGLFSSLIVQVSAAPFSRIWGLTPLPHLCRDLDLPLVGFSTAFEGQETSGSGGGLMLQPPVRGCGWG